MYGVNFLDSINILNDGSTTVRFHDCNPLTAKRQPGHSSAIANELQTYEVQTWVNYTQKISTTSQYYLSNLSITVTTAVK